jgi:hypothetical protein
MEIEFVRIDLEDTDSNFVEVWNCENAFELICPRKWESLKETDSSDMRYCEVCRQNVFLCESAEEFVQQGERPMRCSCQAGEAGDCFRAVYRETIEKPDRATAEGSKTSKGMVGGSVCAQSKV